MHPLVSIVIPAYNSAEFIAETIESVLGQSYKEFEVIVVDDGSTDNTREIISTYRSSVRYIFKENGGVSSARNCGIQASKGEFIAFLDSDDLWTPEKLDRQIEFIESRTEFAAVLTDVNFVDESGKPVGSYQLSEEMRVGDILVRLCLFFSSTVLLRKEVFKLIGFFDEDLKRAEDLDIALRLATKYKIGVVNKPLVKCRKHSNSLSDSVSSHAILLNVLKNFLDENPDVILNHKEECNSAFYKAHLRYGNNLLWRGDCEEAIANLREALSYRKTFEGYKLYLKAHLKKLMLGGQAVGGHSWK